MKKRILFVRHGRQNSARYNLDVSLSPEGRAQALLLEERLKNSNFDILYTSILKRAVETGNIINKSLNLPIIRKPELNEIDWGFLEGKSKKECEVLYPGFLKERKLRLNDVTFPGGECGEDAYKRVRPVIDEMISSEHNNILVVAHGGIIRVLIAGLLSLPFSLVPAFAGDFENTSLTEFSYDTSLKLFTLERLNDYGHLENHPELLRSSWKDL